MNEVNNPTSCDRIEERISFLYGELSEAEAKIFEQHGKSCSICASELTQFGVIKQSIAGWRGQSVMLTSLNSTAALPAPAQLKKRSAWSALSSFIDLSPLWMKAATGFAVVLFCLLLGLAISGMLPRSQPLLAVTPNPASDKVFQEAVNKEVNKRLAELASENASRNSDASIANDRKVAQRPVNAPRKQLASGTTPINTRKPLTRAERNQLAADLRLIGNSDEDSLQLISDRINRQD